MAKTTKTFRFDECELSRWEMCARKAHRSLNNWLETVATQAADRELDLSAESLEDVAKVLFGKPPVAEPVDSSVVQVTPTPPAPYVPKVSERPHVFFRNGTLLAHDDSKCWCKKPVSKNALK